MTFLNFSQLSQDNQIAILEKMAWEAALQFGLEVKEIQNISHSFNSTFLITDKEEKKFSLRVNLNSSRTSHAMKSEFDWLQSLCNAKNFQVPQPILMLTGAPFAETYSADVDRSFRSTLAEWIEGEEVGDTPTDSQLFLLGRAMAELHQLTENQDSNSYSGFPPVNSVFMDTRNLLDDFDHPQYTNEFRSVVTGFVGRCEKAFELLTMKECSQLIHADLHFGNVLQTDTGLAIIDFDDAGFGSRSQDLAIAIFYLRDDLAKERKLLEGYQSITALPSHFPDFLEELLVARQLLLLNTLIESQVAEEIEFIPEYLDKVLRRLISFRDSGKFLLLS